MMKITVNGQEKQVDAGTTITALLTELELADKPAAVEVNKIVVPKKQHEQTQLQDGDVIEIVTLVGGG